MADIVERALSLADCDARAGEPLGRCLRECAAEIEKLRAALAKFADDGNWFDIKDGGGDPWDGTLYRAWRGDGEPEAIARAALSPAEEG